MRREQIGKLNCVVTGPDNGETPSAVVILAHGFGAPGDDLVPLGRVLADRLGDAGSRVQFVFPAAPLSLDSYGGRAWWPIDMVKLQMLMAVGEFRELKTEAPERLPEMSGLLTDVIERVCEQTGLPTSKVVVGGFSQGSMLSTDVALRMRERLGGLVVWSGTLLNEDSWTAAAAASPKGLQVVQSHGVDDPILPYSGAEALRDMLSAAGHAVEFLTFRGGHAIPEAPVRAAARLIETVVRSTES